MQNATTAASASPTSSPEPAAAAAGARAAKIPAPIIDPRPTTTASVTPSRRCSSPGPTDPTDPAIALSTSRTTDTEPGAPYTTHMALPENGHERRGKGWYERRRKGWSEGAGARPHSRTLAHPLRRTGRRVRSPPAPVTTDPPPGAPWRGIGRHGADFTGPASLDLL
ncbi:hypothetical protein Sliba_77390 [Streptomyces nigrescens]|uniref:Uncharacterized protein n=1 Tax=Streptomyces nigrescens TaxID=1920 RepID=A0A640TZC6_STRNI|nr:hypothetical protein Sliba_77390 [Streptomyces libani subsp. libani]GGV96565.1 hypothetical protein GCM10010500_39680 [Streptomyces libani subsp. libani]